MTVVVDASLAVKWVRQERYTTEARALLIDLELRNAYDCMYAVLAEREGCEFWTGDERFWNVARSSFPWVRWVGELSST
jgi:predicted nucleic acid-binding protein